MNRKRNRECLLPNKRAILRTKQVFHSHRYLLVPGGKWNVSSLTSRWDMEGPSRTWWSKRRITSKSSRFIKQKILFSIKIIQEHTTLKNKAKYKIRPVGWAVLLRPPNSPNLVARDFQFFWSKKYFSWVTKQGRWNEYFSFFFYFS